MSIRSCGGGGSLNLSRDGPHRFSGMLCSKHKGCTRTFHPTKLTLSNAKIIWNYTTITMKEAIKQASVVVSGRSSSGHNHQSHHQHHYTKYIYGDCDRCQWLYRNITSCDNSRSDTTNSGYRYLASHSCVDLYNNEYRSDSFRWSQLCMV